jgi:hypothetical protein
MSTIKNVLELRILKGGESLPERINIAAPTRLGRGDLVWKGKRPEPENYGSLKIPLNFAERMGVSRNHAGIYQRAGNGDFLLTDFGSSNGTTIDGHRVVPGHYYSLGKGSKIGLGSKVMVEVVGTKKIGDNNYALLVGNPGHPPLRGVYQDLTDIRTQLETFRYNGNIVELRGGGATTGRVLEEIERIFPLMTVGSHFWLHYSGHGSIDRGLCLGLRDDLRPELLFRTLGKMRGKKAVVLDCCHAGAFANGSVPPLTAVLAGSDEYGKAYEPRIDGVKRGIFTWALIRMLKRKKGITGTPVRPFDLLSELERSLASDPRIARYYRFKNGQQNPQLAGSSFTVMAPLRPIDIVQLSE